MYRPSVLIRWEKRPEGYTIPVGANEIVGEAFRVMFSPTTETPMPVPADISPTAIYMCASESGGGDCPAVERPSFLVGPTEPDARTGGNPGQREQSPRRDRRSS